MTDQLDCIAGKRGLQLAALEAMLWEAATDESAFTPPFSITRWK